MFIHSKLKFIIRFFIIFLIFIFSSCSDERIINEEKFINIYTDLVIAQDTSKIKDQFRDLVFKKYEITDEEFERTIEYYNDKPERWIKFFDKVIEKVENLKEQKSG